MEIIAYALIVVGLIIFLIGSFLFIIAECHESVWWFIGGIFFPIIPFVFLCVHFHEGWPSTKTILLGGAILAIGTFLPNIVAAC